MKKALFAHLSVVILLFLSFSGYTQSTAGRVLPKTPGDGPGATRGAQPVTVPMVQRDIAEAVTLIEKNHVDGKSLDYADVFKSSMSSMLHTLDPHSNYYDAKDTEQFRTEQRSEYYGIGATIGDLSDPQGKVIATFIKATFDQAPAHKAGLRYGDKIVTFSGPAVQADGSTKVENNVSMLGRPFYEVRNYLRGPKDTTIKLEVEHADTGKRETVDITRGAVAQPSISEAYMIRPGTGYLAMRNGFTRKTADEFYADLNKLKADGMQQLVIDLRDNPGGLVLQALSVANAFLSDGQTVFTQRSRIRGLNEPFLADNRSPEKMPIVVLVNRNTASASEIVAGALQDHDRALIAGVPTFGKGLVQNPFEIGDSMLLLTIAKYETPSGRLIQRDYSNGDLYAYMNDGGSLRNDDAETPPHGGASKTDLGRSVYSGGGITPDVIVKPETITVERSRFQNKLANPVFAFALDLSLGRVKAFETYKAATPIKYGYDIKPTDFPVTPNLYDTFKQFAVTKYKFTPAQVDGEREFIERALRSELVTAAYGSTSSFQVFNQYDDQLQKSIDLLPQARQLALQAEKARTSARRNPAN